MASSIPAYLSPVCTPTLPHKSSPYPCYILLDYNPLLGDSSADPIYRRLMIGVYNDLLVSSAAYALFASITPVLNPLK